MRKLIAGLLLFLAGWGAGWFSYRYLGTGPPALSRSPVPAVVQFPPAGAPAAPTAVPAPVAVADLALLLQRDDFVAVMERYESLRQRADETALAQARERILAHARELTAAQRFGQAEQLLQAFLLAAYRDVDARVLLAEVYLGQGDVLAAVDQLYEAKGYAWRAEQLQRLTARIRSMVAELAQTLKRHEDRNALLALFQHLVQLEPDHAPWFIELAAAQLALDDTGAARTSLQLVAQDPGVGAQAQALLAELTVAFADAPGADSRDALQEVVGIPLRRSGSHFIVAAQPAGGRDVQLLIDTGASLTIFTPEALARRGIRYEDTGRTAVFNTANGRVVAPVYRLDTLAVGDWQVSPIEIGVLELGRRADVDGLLGMNFLRHFQFFIDQNEASLRLSANR